MNISFHYQKHYHGFSVDTAVLFLVFLSLWENLLFVAVFLFILSIDQIEKQQQNSRESILFHTFDEWNSYGYFQSGLLYERWKPDWFVDVL